MRIALPFVLALLSVAAHAQTEYVIPDGTGVDFIFYNTYSNMFYDIPLTVNGVVYYASGYIHFTAGNPLATMGSITFTHYNYDGSTTGETDPLTNINENPFTLPATTATANFNGALFQGSLTYNIKEYCGRRYCNDAMTTVNGVHSNFTLTEPAKVSSLYPCGSDRHACLH